ncbi:MAG TPA: hypothetical protein ENO20_14070 [Bacteroides sp.]|nr:hypothetical protein [Bacteroides sp.]
MIPPCRWQMKRPGMLIPVFFLSCTAAGGQFHAGEAAVAATGESYSTRAGYSAAMQNQAGLGRIRRPALSLHHQQPFVTGEVSVTSVAFQFPVTRGAFGIHMTGYGIPGLRYGAAWISYGVELHPDVYAGAGIHFHVSSVPGEWIHRWGTSCALGIQVRVNEELMLGAHVMHPAAWDSGRQGGRMKEMTIATGCSYTFFQTATLYADLHVCPGTFLQSGFGLETMIANRVRLCMGMQHAPLSVACGVEVLHRSWSVQIAGQYILDTGNIPHASLAYTL